MISFWYQGFVLLVLFAVEDSQVHMHVMTAFPFNFPDVSWLTH